MGLTERELCPHQQSGEPAAVETVAPPWFAVVIKPHHEQTVRQALLEKGLESFAPTYTAVQRWSDRLQRLQLPLFPGYVFCRFARNNRVPVLRTPGVRSIVSFGSEMMPVPEQEIERIRWMVSAAPAVEPWPFLRAGQRVRVQHGPLAGIEGILAEVRNTTRLVVSLEMLQRSVAVQLNRDEIRPLD
jgi:transcription antitermination factor NusG